MSFGQSIATCFAKYANFEGRATRPEFWWFILFTLLVSCAFSIFSGALAAVFHVGVFLPTLAAGSRRLHDTNRSGWMQLFYLLPVAGLILLIILFAQEAKEPNRFVEDRPQPAT